MDSLLLFLCEKLHLGSFIGRMRVYLMGVGWLVGLSSILLYLVLWILLIARSKSRRSDSDTGYDSLMGIYLSVGVWIQLLTGCLLLVVAIYCCCLILSCSCDVNTTTIDNHRHHHGDDDDDWTNGTTTAAAEDLARSAEGLSSNHHANEESTRALSICNRHEGQQSHRIDIGLSAAETDNISNAAVVSRTTVSQYLQSRDLAQAERELYNDFDMEAFITTPRQHIRNSNANNINTINNINSNVNNNNNSVNNNIIISEGLNPRRSSLPGTLHASAKRDYRLYGMLWLILLFACISMVTCLPSLLSDALAAFIVYSVLARVIEVVMMWMIITTDLSDYERIPVDRSVAMNSQATNNEESHTHVAVVQNSSDPARNPVIIMHEDRKTTAEDDVTKRYLSDSSDRFQSYITRMKGRRRRRWEEPVRQHATEYLSSLKQQSIDKAMKESGSAAGCFHDKYNMYVDSVHSSSNSDEDSNVPYY